MNDLIRRHAALEKTLAKYRGKAFERGVTDCAAMLRSHLVAMGHKGLPKLPRYRNVDGAKKALAGLGVSNLEQLLDAHLTRIPFAHAIPGDVVLIKGEDEIDAVAVMASARKVAGWIGGHMEMVIYTPHEVIGAWRA